jgi:hypothetical protein
MIRVKGGTFLLPALFKTLVLPPLLVYLLTHFRLALPTSVQIVAYILSFPLIYILRSHLSSLITRYSAYTSGSIDIPGVKDRWILNLDVLRDWARSGAEEEVGRMMVVLGRRWGKTYNTRVLGEDQVSGGPIL